MIGDDLGSPEKRAGDRVRLECVSSGGNPIPQIEWRRNGRPLPEGQSVRQSVSQSGIKNEEGECKNHRVSTGLTIRSDTNSRFRAGIAVT